MNKTLNCYFGACLFGALLVVSPAFSTGLSAFQDDPFGSSAPSLMEKQTTETWQQFMVRMNQAGVVNDALLQQWQSGKSITVPSTMAVTRVRTETRTRMVPVTRMRTETTDDGQELQVPYTENQAQTYQVQVPYTEQVVQNINVPAPGALANNAKFSKFARPSSGLSLPAVPLEQPQSDASFQKSTVKTSTESWQGYLERLQTLKVVKADQIAKWKNGQPLEIKTNVPFTRMRQETRTRSVSVTRMVSQQNDEGQTIQVPKQELVKQNYTVQVPYTEMRSVTISIPESGSAAANATNSGVNLSGFRSKKRKSRSSDRSAKKSRGNKKPSAQLVSLMKIRPKQSDARFQSKYDLGELDIKGFEKDGSRIQEVRNGSRTLRQFADTDGDNKIDTWIFFKDGKESYREQDLDGDGKVDQYQFHENGKVRNGIDENQDGKIDIWDDE